MKDIAFPEFEENVYHPTMKDIAFLNSRKLSIIHPMKDIAFSEFEEIVHHPSYEGHCIS
jgi:hypothetical protein